MRKFRDFSKIPKIPEKCTEKKSGKFPPRARSQEGGGPGTPPRTPPRAHFQDPGFPRKTAKNGEDRTLAIFRVPGVSVGGSASGLRRWMRWPTRERAGGERMLEEGTKSLTLSQIRSGGSPPLGSSPQDEHLASLRITLRGEESPTMSRDERDGDGMRG